MSEKAQVGDGSGVVLKQRARGSVAIEDADLAGLEAVTDVVGIHRYRVAMAAANFRREVRDFGNLIRKAPQGWVVMPKFDRLLIHVAMIKHLALQDRSRMPES